MLRTQFAKLNLSNKLTFKSASNALRPNIHRQFSNKLSMFSKNCDLAKSNTLKINLHSNFGFKFILGSVSLAAFTAGMVPFGELQNDALYQQPSLQSTVSSDVQNVKRKLSYDDLTYGSIFGLFLGIVVGKLSYVLALISMATFLSVEFLRSRNILYLNWSGLVPFGSSKIDLRKLMFDNFSFKLSFTLSFIIAAWNMQ